MLDIAWYVFSQTGNVESYLLFKDLVSDEMEGTSETESEQTEYEQAIH